MIRLPAASFDRAEILKLGVVADIGSAVVVPQSDAEPMSCPLTVMMMAVAAQPQASLKTERLPG